MLYNRRMDDEKLVFERVVEALNSVVTRIHEMHGPHHDFGTGVPLCRAEAHLIQAIGELPEVNVTGLAQHLGVTKGAVSQMVRKLVSKGLLRRSHRPGNAKDVHPELTELGAAGYRAHAQFHAAMLDAVRAYHGEQMLQRMEALLAALQDVTGVLDEFERRGHKRRPGTSPATGAR